MARRVPFEEMKIRELMETNNHIGDLIIAMRDKNGILIRNYHIGADAGIEPIRRHPLSEKYEYLEMNINAYDIKDEYRVYINRIPKQLLEQEVFSWRSTAAYRNGFNSDLERVCIEVRDGVVVELPKERKDAGQLAGQMEINDFPEVLP